MSEKLRVGIIGATGMVGQRLITLLENHPYFEISALCASGRSAGKAYSESVNGRWKMQCDIPESIKDMTVVDSAELEKVKSLVDFVFCAVNMKKEDVIELEERYAKAEIPVVSCNSANRCKGDVPMLIPEINGEHLKVIETQKKRLGTKRGFIMVKPNCSIQCYVPMLTPLRKYGIKQVFVSTYQAISGAGKTFNEWPEMIDNINPYIGGEEKKSEVEPLHIWGNIVDGEVVADKDTLISARCIRVPVTDGHTATVFVKFENKPTKEQIIEEWKNFKGLPQELELPHAPKQFVTYFEEDDRPQAKLDRDIYGGMGVTVGRLDEDNIFDWKFVGLAHNTLRGAAGGAVLGAELAYRLGYLK